MKKYNPKNHSSSQFAAFIDTLSDREKSKILVDEIHNSSESYEQLEKRLSLPFGGVEFVLLVNDPELQSRADSLRQHLNQDMPPSSFEEDLKREIEYTTEVAKKYPAALKFLSRFKNTMAGKAIESQREPGMIEPYAGLVVAVNALVFVNVGGLVNAAIATNAAVYVKVEVELAVHQHQAIATTTSVMTAGE